MESSKVVVSMKIMMMHLFLLLNRANLSKTLSKSMLSLIILYRASTIPGG